MYIYKPWTFFKAFYLLKNKLAVYLPTRSRHNLLFAKAKEIASVEDPCPHRNI